MRLSERLILNIKRKRIDNFLMQLNIICGVLKEIGYEKLYIKSFCFPKYAVRYRLKGKNSQELKKMNEETFLYWTIYC